MRSSLDNTFTKGTSRTDPSVPNWYYIYGKVDGRTFSQTVHCTRVELTEHVRVLEKEHHAVFYTQRAR